MHIFGHLGAAQQVVNTFSGELASKQRQRALLAFS